MAKVAIVGAGAWGTALACQAARMQHEVVLWAREAEVVAEVNAEHRNTPFLPEAPLPDAIRASDDAEECVRGADLVVLVPPSQHLRAVASLVAPALSARALVAVASKGIEESSLLLLSEVIAQVLPQLGTDRLAFLSGPSFAREVAKGLPTDIAAGSEDMLAARRVQPLLHAPTFRVYTSSDPVGVQVGGAIKNVIAVAAGACDGLGLGTNARASLITRGLAEITRLGVALGADPLTFLGLAGVGDLVLTCTGDLSRNRTLGCKVAEGVDPKTWLESRRSVAEGFFTADAAHALARKLELDMPISEQVYHVLHKGRPLQEAIMRLLSRESKDELQGIRTSD
jgi:glycerol-3-phosphate dehydrogenase (NAD(P)+)